jgi:tricorn protease-like protein
LAHGTQVRLWDTATAAVRGEIPQSHSISALAWHPAGRWLATGDARGAIHLWDPAGMRIKSVEQHRTKVTALAFAPDGHTLASAGGTDGYVYLWSLPDLDPLLLIPEATDLCTVETVAFVPGTDLVAAGGIDWLSTGGSDGAICLWDVVNRYEIATFPVGTLRLAVRPDGRQLAAATLEHSVCLWDLKRNSLEFELWGHEERVTALVYAPDGRFLATASEDGIVRLWDAATGDPTHFVRLDTPIRDLAFAPDGRHLYTANANTTSYLIPLDQ